MIRSSRKQTEINAVHEDDVRAFLERVGVADALDRRELRCAICDSGLGDRDVAAARARDGLVILACSRPECIRELS